MDQIDLLREQHKILSGEVALQTSAPKRLSEEAGKKPKEQILLEIRNLKEETGKKNDQIASLEKQIPNSINPHGKEKLEKSLSLTELMAQLHDKSSELEVKAADNRIIQEQLNQKALDCEELQETVVFLSSAVYHGGVNSLTDDLPCFSENTHIQHMSIENAAIEDSNDMLLRQAQASEIKELKKKLAELTYSRNELELQNNKFAGESSYAKGLASAAAVELTALSEEVTKLMNQNERLNAELQAQKKLPAQHRTAIPSSRNGRRDSFVKPQGLVLPLV